ncbi:hypothetical protein DEJ49_16840 [Streptomyces venezuelae]|uniref:Uncharacterized protein n=1 Tax=Streptomyces venezuelae TaxID=54571 RepID=A0A5P2CHV8_STRVZ|nr:hypothetical protein [Streptomyces venezuelae]QES42436.1 hypothetical protein DEJ49_16840 [Streptomyces venezuelae]
MNAPDRDRPEGHRDPPEDHRPDEFALPVPPVPPMPPTPPVPTTPPLPPVPPAPPWGATPPAPPAPPHRRYALAAALLNLSGLGLGYLLLNRRLLALLSCAATAALLLVALPADVDGVPGVVLVGYAVLLLLTAAHGAYLATHDPRPHPLRAPIAIGLGVVLLAVPAGASFAYEDARDEAVERMLIDRIDEADRLVEALDGRTFDGATRPRYEKALRVHRDLADDHPGSRAADRLPDSLTAYYTSVAAPYAAGRYCDAVTPLKHLRTVPGTFAAPARKRLGALASWPDDRLATSLYECGTAALGRPGADAPLSELIRAFPESAQAAKVGPALRAAIDTRSDALKGSDPCTGVDELRALGRTTSALPGDTRTLHATTARAVERGVYACGVDEFEDGAFTKAAETLTGFVREYPRSGKRDRAEDIAVAAEIAAERPAAGRHLPPAHSSGRGGGPVELTVANLGPGPLEILYTGPTTGTVKLEDCSSCRIYATRTRGDAACRTGVTKYPRTTLRLPAGAYHFLYKRAGVRNRADGAKLSAAYRYTDCSFVTRGTAGLGLT